MKLCLRSVVAVLALTLAARSACAQLAPPRTDRPYRGLFGGGIAETDELLTVDASLGGGYDDDILSAQNDTVAPSGNIGATYGQLDSHLTYALHRSRLGIGASLATSSRYDPVLTSEFVAAHGGSFGAWLQLSPRTRLTGSQSVTYQPFYSLSLFPPLFESGLAEARAPDHDFGILRQRYISYASAVDLTHALSPRASVAMSYGHVGSDFGSGSRDFRSQRAAVHFTRGLTGRLSLNLGYDYEHGIYGLHADERHALHHGLAGGIVYTKRISSFSRTTLSIAAGPSAISEGGRTYYRVTVSAGTSREIGRTWDVSLAYDRRPRFIETFNDPLFEDGLSIGVGGLINQRIQFASTVGVSIGEVGVPARNGLDTYYGTTAVTVGLTRFAGLRFDYSYFRYSFDNAAFLPSGLFRAHDRQRVGAHLILWAPLIHRERKADASR